MYRRLYERYSRQVVLQSQVLSRHACEVSSSWREKWPRGAVGTSGLRDCRPGARRCRNASGAYPGNFSHLHCEEECHKPMICTRHPSHAIQMFRSSHKHAVARGVLGRAREGAKFNESDADNHASITVPHAAHLTLESSPRKANQP